MELLLEYSLFFYKIFNTYKIKNQRGSAVQVLRVNRILCNILATALEFATAPSGKVLQVVTATDSTQRSTTSTSFVTASNTLTVSITPSSASNKIFIIVTGALYIDGNGGYGSATVFRGATNIGDATYGMATVYAASSTVIGSMAMNYLDSPNTTSATTYEVRIKRQGATNVQIQEPTSKASITVFEIAG
jgi:hypothetical protein